MNDAEYMRTKENSLSYVSKGLRKLTIEAVGETLDSIIARLQTIRRCLPKKDWEEDDAFFLFLVAESMRLETLVERLNGGPLERIDVRNDRKVF